MTRRLRTRRSLTRRSPTRRATTLVTATIGVALLTACGTATAAPADAAPTGAAAPVDEIPPGADDGVDERLLPDENLLGRTGWSLTGESADLVAPWYENPCSPDSAVTEWSDPLGNVGRTWEVDGFNGAGLPAPVGQIAVDLYGYGSPQDASEALATVRAMVADCALTHPVGGVDTVLGDADLHADSPFPLEEGFVLQTQRGENAHVIVSRIGQTLVLTAYQAYSGDGTVLDLTALTEAVQGPTKETIYESF